MANEVIRLKYGPEANLNGEAIEPGKILVAINGTGERAKIFFDKDSSTRIPVADDSWHIDAGNIDGIVQLVNGGTGANTTTAAKANLGLGDAKVYHAVCSTAAATAEKVALTDDSAFTDAQLVKGVVVFVTFSNTNSAAVADLKLKVGTSTAKPLKREYNGGTSNLAAVGWLRANCTYMFTYDGTNWVNLTDNQNSSYSAMDVTEMKTGTAATNRVMRADYLKTFLSTLGGTGLTLNHNATNGIILNHSNSITAGTVKSTTNTVGFGGAITIPSITYDSEGHITSTTTTSVTLPSNPNTDTKVTQSASTASNWRKILLHYKDDSASTTAVTTSTNQVYAAVGVSVQPSTGTVRADQYNIKDKVQLQYNSTTESLNFVFI